MKRSIAAVLTLACLTAAGCSSHKHTGSISAASAPGSPTSVASPSPSATPSTPPPDVKARLLTLGDMPTGWSVDNSSNSSSDSTPACFKSADSFKSKATSNGEVDYQGSADGLPLMEEVAGYLPQSGAQQAVDAVTNVLDGCGHISITDSGQTLSGQLGAMSFPTIGDQSKAYQMSLAATASGLSITAGFDIVVFRVGQIAAVLMYADLGTPDVTQVQQFAQRAAAKLAGGSASAAASVSATGSGAVPSSASS